jgi:hypothetical protein
MSEASPQGEGRESPSNPSLSANYLRKTKTCLLCKSLDTASVELCEQM